MSYAPIDGLLNSFLSWKGAGQPYAKNIGQIGGGDTRLCMSRTSCASMQFENLAHLKWMCNIINGQGHCVACR